MNKKFRAEQDYKKFLEELPNNLKIEVFLKFITLSIF